MAATLSYLKRIEAKIESLVESGIWPNNDPGKLYPTQWFNNFDESERVLAAALIDIFVYVPNSHVIQALHSSIKMLFQKFGENSLSIDDRKRDIEEKLDKTVFVPVEGEHPNPTDSGNYICRLLRQTFKIEESKIQNAYDALNKYTAEESNIVFVDDVVGTGNQIISTWNRIRRTTSPRSFQEAYDKSKLGCYFVCLSLTSSGNQNILSKSRGLMPIGAHYLSERDYYEQSLLRISDHPLGSNLSDHIEVLLKKYSNRLILPDYMTNHRFAEYGFQELGLTLGFQHSIPDVTLPIYWSGGGETWTPLISRG